MPEDVDMAGMRTTYHDATGRARKRVVPSAKAAPRRAEAEQVLGILAQGNLNAEETVMLRDARDRLYAGYPEAALLAAEKLTRALTERADR